MSRNQYNAPIKTIHDMRSPCALDAQAAAMLEMSSGGSLTLEDARHITEGQARAARLEMAERLIQSAGDRVSIDFALLRSSGALETPVDQERAGLARRKARRQLSNARRLMGALWRYLTSRKAW